MNLRTVLPRRAKAALPLLRAFGASLLTTTPLRTFVRLPDAKQRALLHLAGDPAGLVGRGWFESHAAQASVDALGQPLPWYVYPAIDFLSTRVRRDMSVLEFGAGHSTLWWAARVAHVTTFESDRAWFERIARRVPSNVDLRLADTDSRAVIESRILPGLGVHDVVIIDAGERNVLLQHAAGMCTPAGVVILDNSDRSEYGPGIDALLSAGFRHLQFHGHGPINSYAWSTSVMYRSDNCFGL